ncbi:hypothetical protein ABZY09_20680 [Streptomyces sp. NPDC002928]|uniref:hypothetical protein n=1 Tax=Streptomyces sp. NPDC002928 TaxID=3154440 RepID=UPI0033A5EEBE
MTMRLCTPASLCLAAAAALLPVPAATASAAAAGPGPACAASGDRAFPLTTRIHGGPASYEAGGGYGIWYLDLTNTTARACSGIHPVVVLVDGQHALKPTQPRLDFYDGVRPRPVHFEKTDEDELVGAFGQEGKKADDFPGFTVGPRKTVTVKVRLALTSDAAPNEITVNAAVVQRHEDDGDWVGESNDYRFHVETDTDSDSDTDTDSTSDTDSDTDSTSDTDTGSATGPATDPTADRSTHPDRISPGTHPDPATDPTTGTGARTDPGSASVPSPDPDPVPDPTPHATLTTGTTTPSTAPDDSFSFADQLARTGLGTPAGALAAALVLLVAGGALVLVRRRR